MAITTHYSTTNMEVVSESTDTTAILYVRKKSDGSILGRQYVPSQARATTAYNRAVAMADAAELALAVSPVADDWTDGKTGISGLPVEGA